MEHSEGENTPKVAKQVFGKDKEEKVKKDTHFQLRYSDWSGFIESGEGTGEEMCREP